MQEWIQNHYGGDGKGIKPSNHLWILATRKHGLIKGNGRCIFCSICRVHLASDEGYEMLD